MTDQQAPEIRVYLVAGATVAFDEDEFMTTATPYTGLAYGPEVPLIDRLRRELLASYDGLSELLGDMGLLDDVKVVVEVAEYDEKGRRHHSSTTLTHEVFAQSASDRAARDLLLTAQASRERAQAKEEGPG